MWASDLVLGLVAGAALIAAAWFAITGWRRNRSNLARCQDLESRLHRESAGRKAAEEDLRQQSEWAAAAQSANIGFYVWDLIADRCLYCTEEFARIHGLSVEEYLANYGDIERDTLMVHPDDRALYRNATKTAFKAEQGVDIEYRIVTPAGEVRHVREVEHNYTFEDGKLARSIGIVQDISETRRAQSWLFQALDATAPLFALYDSDDRLVFVDNMYRSFLGLQEEPQTVGMAFEEILRLIVDKFRPDATPDEQDAWIKKRLGRRQSPARNLEVRLVSGDWIELNDVLLGDGSVLTIGTDITKRKEMELRLQQAQRMEAVGQLTSGLAHDFNNLLGVIHGNAELLAEREEQEPDLVDAILHAAQRGAELTHRLLAFSRQQPLRPQAIDLPALIERMTPQLQRTLGQPITLDVEFGPGLWPAMADPGQLENALLNLTLNARSAIRGGGRVTIACNNLSQDRRPADQELSEGDFVSIQVRDSGCGMTPEVLARAFEPFFTTGEATQSSGLGLSMIYGFARQSGGLIRLDSAPGQGTSAELLLPRAQAAAAGQGEPSDQDRNSVPQGKGELILVVDDTKPVRAMAVALVRRLGYRTVEASDAAEALEALAAEPVQLALVDIVLTGDVSGPVFAQQAKRKNPDLKVIFMSGYSAEAASDSGFLKDGNTLLTKPFRYHALATALHTALAQDRNAGATTSDVDASSQEHQGAPD